MDEEWTAATLGIVAFVLTGGAVVAPYLLLPADQLDGVAAYYGVGAVSPLLVGVLGLLGAIVFAAGREDRSDPDLVAGITLVIGVFSLVVGLQWALSFYPVTGASTATLEFMSDHRWTVPAGGALEALAAYWYAGARGLVPLPSRDQ